MSNTHWDREWVYSMQRTRYNLVALMDLVLDLFETEKGFKHFHLDSQTAPLLDYLEIRPEREPIIRRLVKSGKLAIGPWFTLPDEFCISGESIVRNLLLGHAIADRLGGVSKTGYSPFSWGQCSQMPQIYKGFGIDMMMFYRGVNARVAPRAEFIWRGADGTEIVASRLGRRPRYNVWYILQRPAYWGYRLDQLSRFEAGWSDGHGAFRMASGPFAALDYQAAHPRHAYDGAALPDAARMALHEQDADWSTPHRFWSAGHDSSFPDAREVRLVEDARAALRDEADVFWSTLKAFQDGVLAHRRDDWPVVSGEMRHAFTAGSTSPLLGGIISARTYLKQDNHTTEQLLTRLAEPLAVFAALLGAPYPRAFVDRAYRYLLENHAHDSIGGCGRDVVAQDMLDRSRQCREIATCVLESAVREIAGAIHPGNGAHARKYEGTSGNQNPDRQGAGHQNPDRKGAGHPSVDRAGAGPSLAVGVLNPGHAGAGHQNPDRKGAGHQNPDRKGGASHSHRRPAAAEHEQQAAPARVAPPRRQLDDDVALLVFNPSPFPRSEVVTVILETPRNWPHADIEIVDDAGEPVEFQPVGGAAANEERVYNPNDVFNYLTMNRREVHLFVENAPAMGYRTYRVRAAAPARRRRESMLRAPACIAGEFARVDVSSDGTLGLHGPGAFAACGLGYFADSGAAGNPWIHEPPERDALFTTAGCGGVLISAVEDGPLVATLRVEIPWRLPEGLAPDGRTRSDRLTLFKIVNTVTVRRGRPWIEITTELDNVARDHWLRVCFPSVRGLRASLPTGDSAAQTVAAQTPFDVVERPFGTPDPALYDEPLQLEQPLQGFVDVSDGEYGMAILNDGLRAYAAADDQDRTLSLTLLRAYSMRFFVPEKHDHAALSAGSQCPGPHRFRYAIYPHKGDWRSGDVWRAAERFTTPMIAAQIALTPHGAQPASRSFLELDPADLHVSAVKQSEDGAGWVVRVLNPGVESVTARVRLNGGFAPPTRALSPTQRVRAEFALPAGRGKPWRRVRLLSLEEKPIEPLVMDGDGWVRFELGAKRLATVAFA